MTQDKINIKTATAKVDADGDFRPPYLMDCIKTAAGLRVAFGDFDQMGGTAETPPTEFFIAVKFDGKKIGECNIHFDSTVKDEWLADIPKNMAQVEDDLDHWAKGGWTFIAELDTIGEKVGAFGIGFMTISTLHEIVRERVSDVIADIAKLTAEVEEPNAAINAALGIKPETARIVFGGVYTDAEDEDGIPPTLYMVDVRLDGEVIGVCDRRFDKAGNDKWQHKHSELGAAENAKMWHPDTSGTGEWFFTSKKGSIAAECGIGAFRVQSELLADAIAEFTDFFVGQGILTAEKEDTSWDEPDGVTASLPMILAASAALDILSGVIQKDAIFAGQGMTIDAINGKLVLCESGGQAITLRDAIYYFCQLRDNEKGAM